MLTDTILPNTRSDSRERRTSVVDRLCRKLVFRALQQLGVGVLTIHEGSGQTCFGDESAAEDARASIWIDDLRFYRALVSVGRSAPANPISTDTGEPTT